MDLSAVREPAADSPHVLDAILCGLAGCDFLGGKCFQPKDKDIALIEGWIWVLQPA
jgi:hypothetical protein